MHEQNGCHFPDEIFQYILLNGNVRIMTQISLTIAHKGAIYSESTCVNGSGLVHEQLMTQAHGRLTHRGRVKMATMLQTTFSNAYSWMKSCDFLLQFLWSLFLRVQLAISQDCFR